METPASPFMLPDLGSALSDDDLRRMSVNAWREAVRCWQEYRRADARRDDSDDARWLAQTLHDAAWSAEHYWRALYDASKVRGIRPSLPPDGPVSLPSETV